MLNNDDKIKIGELIKKGYAGNKISKKIGKRKQDVYTEIRQQKGTPKTVKKVQERKKYTPVKSPSKPQKTSKSQKIPKPQKVPKVRKVQKSQQKDREPTQFEKYSAHELARSRVQQHINEKINNLREVDKDFNNLISTLEVAQGMREDSKMRIATEYYLYWAQGDREKAFRIGEKLFTQSGKETYIPSDV